MKRVIKKTDYAKWISHDGMDSSSDKLHKKRHVQFTLFQLQSCLVLRKTVQDVNIPLAKKL